MTDSRNPSSSPVPDVPVRRKLLDTLRILERDPSGNENARLHLRGWLTDENDKVPEPHLELHELKALAHRRLKEGEDFQVPEHLLTCKICMELFQVLCGDHEIQGPPSSSDGGRISSGSTRRRQPGDFARLHLKIGRLVSVAAIIFLSLLLWTYLQPPGIILESGALRQQSITLRDGRLPARKSLEALQRTELGFLDGSKIILEPGARIRTGKTPGFQPRLLLESGQARFNFRDPQTAPRLRSGELLILPSAADFELNASLQVLTVRRGSLRIQHNGDEQTLFEGARWESAAE